MLLMSLVLAAMAACARPGTVDQVALRAAVGKEPVVLLSAAWCGYCRKLRTQLEQWDVPFVEHDVESSAAGSRAYRLLRGSGVPILLVNEHHIRGYAPLRARELLVEAGLLRTGRMR
jgi:glutaredoxin